MAQFRSVCLTNSDNEGKGALTDGLQSGARWRLLLGTCLALALLACGGPSRAANRLIKVGLQRLTPDTPVYMAQKEGYFAAEGLDLQLVPFQTSEPIGVGAMAGDIDIGIIGINAAFYNLAGRGALKIICAYASESPGFHSSVWVASNKAYNAGLHSLKGLGGHVIGGGTTGGASYYLLGLVTEKNGIDFKSVQFRALQSNTNVVAAVVGGQVDAAIVPGTYILPQIQKGLVQVIGWVSDTTPFQLGVTFVRAKLAEESPDVVAGFLRGYRKGARKYYDAFTAPDGSMRDGPTAPKVLEYASQFVGQPPAVARLAAGFVDPDLRVDIKDVVHQIEWFKAQGIVKPDVDPEKILDRKFIIPIPDAH